MAGGSGQAILIEFAVYEGVLREAAAENRDGIVAAIAVAGEFDSFGSDEDVNASPVEGSAKRVGVQRLAPLVVRLLVTVAAVVGRGKRVWLQEGVADYGRITWGRDIVRAEGEVVSFADFVGVQLTSCILIR